MVKKKPSKTVNESLPVEPIASKSKNFGKWSFTLLDIVPVELDHRYGILTQSNIGNLANPPRQTTKITDLAPVNNLDTISFFDEAKVKHKCTVSMIDFSTSKSIPTSGDYYCFWDKNPCPKGVMLIGCPVRYVSNQAKKRYFSEISKDTYTIIENVTTSRSKRLTPPISLQTDCHYETDGIFCSWNCALAFAEDNRSNPLYRLSISLLLKMYNDFNGSSNTTIAPAHHWRLLKCFGGNQTIEEFRNNFSKVDYDHYGLVKSFRPLATLIEEKLRF